MVMSNGDIRPCSDLRPLNHRTVLDTYPLPSIRSFLNKFKGARVFSRLDLKAAYYQIPVSTISLQNGHPDPVGRVQVPPPTYGVEEPQSEFSENGRGNFRRNDDRVYLYR